MGERNIQFRNCERIPDCEVPLTWHHHFALARSFAVPRQKRRCQVNRHRPYCSDELAVPLSESASLRRVVPCRNAHALVLLSHAHRPRSISLDRSTVAPQRQWTKVSTLHAEHSILGAVDIYDWRLPRAARKPLVVERALPPLFGSAVGAAIFTGRDKCLGSSCRFAIGSSMECGESDAMRHVDTCRAAALRMERAPKATSSMCSRLNCEPCYFTI